jgi:hypothetical protein
MILKLCVNRALSDLAMIGRAPVFGCSGGCEPERKTDRERTLCSLVGSHLGRFEDPKLATSAYILGPSYMAFERGICLFGLGLLAILCFKFIIPHLCDLTTISDSLKAPGN